MAKLVYDPKNVIKVNCCDCGCNEGGEGSECADAIVKDHNGNTILSLASGSEETLPAQTLSVTIEGVTIASETYAALSDPPPINWVFPS
jgi:hypothetical protein